MTGAGALSLTSNVQRPTSKRARPIDIGRVVLTGVDAGSIWALAENSGVPCFTFPRYELIGSTYEACAYGIKVKRERKQK
jgi:hypothetical protein